MVKIPSEFGDKEEVPEKKLRTTVLECINLLDYYRSRMVSKTDLYFASNNEEDKLDYLESISFNLNYFTQSFMDILDIIQLHRGEAYCDSLSSYIRYFKKLNLGNEYNEDEALDFLITRNEMIHDYYEFDALGYELTTNLLNYGKGLEEIVIHLKNYCQEQNLMEKIIK